MNKKICFIICFLICASLTYQNSDTQVCAKTKVTVKNWVKTPQYNLVRQFLFGLTFLLENSWVAGFSEHLETTTIMINECGMSREIEPLVGIVIAFHESWGIATIRAEKTGDTGLMQIKPKYAYKPDNYENYQTLRKKAHKTPSAKDKIKLLQKADKAKTKIYKDKYTVPELQEAQTNVHVGCWSLKMWKDEWNGGNKKKGQSTYIAKYAGGGQPHPRAWGFQKWVHNQVKKTKKRLEDKSNVELLWDIAILIKKNTVTRNNSSYLEVFNKKINLQERAKVNFSRLFAQLISLFASHINTEIRAYIIIQQHQLFALMLKQKSSAIKPVYLDNASLLVKLQSYYEEPNQQ